MTLDQKVDCVVCWCRRQNWHTKSIPIGRRKAKCRDKRNPEHKHMNANPQDVQIFVAVVKDILTAISAVVAATVAVIGLRTWRKQLKGKTEYELAQKFLRAVYSVREAVAIVRNPFMSAGEIEHAMKEADIEGNPLQDATVHSRSQGAVYQRRWQKLQGALDELELSALEAEALWGQEVRDNLKPLSECISTLAVNIEWYLRDLGRPAREYDAAEVNQRNSVIYGWSNDSVSNTFSAQIAHAVSHLEKYLKPRLKL